MGRRKKYSSKFETKVVLEALKERKTLKELAVQFELYPQQISNWKSEFLNEAEGIFDGKVKSKKTEAEEERDRLLKTIGELKVENDFLAKILR